MSFWFSFFVVVFLSFFMKVNSITHLELPKLHRVLAVPSAKGLKPLQIIKSDDIDLTKNEIQSTLVISKSKGPSKQFEISVLRHIRFVVLRKKQFEQPIFTNDYLI